MTIVTLYLADDVALRKLTEIKEQMRRIVDAEADLQRERDTLARLLLEAYEERIRPSAIQETTGLSRQRLHQILQGERAKRAK